MGTYTVDHPGALAMWVPDAIMFDTVKPIWITIHKTAGFQTAQDCAAYFQRAGGPSSHYIVGLDGTIVQCVPEWKGAGANCCTEPGHASFLPDWDGKVVNGNLVTISIEHIDPSTDNSTPCPPAQIQASTELIRGICQRNAIPMRAGDANGGIIGHNQIDPISRARCPGNYPMTQVIQTLQGGSMGIPNGWHDDGTTLTAPNGKHVKQGNRQYILTHDWNPDNVPLEDEHGANPVQLHGNWGAGTRQTMRDSVFWWTQGKGVVYEGFPGMEIDAAYKLIASLQGQLDQANKDKTTLQSQVTTLNSQLAQAKSATALTDLQQIATIADKYRIK